MREENLPILRTYADALIDAASKGGALESVFEEAVSLAPILRSNPALLHFLDRPSILSEEKKDVIKRVFGDKLSPLMLHLPQLLVDKNRGTFWADIVEHFIKMVEKDKGIHAACVTTAISLSEDDKRKLHEALEKFTGKRLHIEFRENPSVIGGVHFHSDEMLIDGTVSGEIKALKNHLMKVRIESPEAEIDTSQILEQEEE
ncbi:MAG: ATP synthase F1 subunit delta [Candidatus Sumerlaeia bacterium]